MMDSENNLGQIRDLLVGPQIRSLEERLDRIAEKLDQEVHALRRELEQRSESLDSLLRAELGKIQQQLTADRNERKAAAENLAAEIAELAARSNQASQDLENQINQMDQVVRRDLQEQLKGAEKTLHAGQNALRCEILELVERIQRDKMDRATISRLFHEVADSLNGSVAEAASQQIDEHADA